MRGLPDAQILDAGRSLRKCACGTRAGRTPCSIMWRMACCALSRPQWRATRYRPRSIAAVDPAQEIKSPSSMNSRSTTARVCGKRSRKLPARSSARRPCAARPRRPAPTRKCRCRCPAAARAPLGGQPEPVLQGLRHAPVDVVIAAAYRHVVELLGIVRQARRHVDGQARAGAARLAVPAHHPPGRVDLPAASAVIAGQAQGVDKTREGGQRELVQQHDANRERGFSRAGTSASSS